MSRQRRVVVPKLPMHITQRGNNRAMMFLDPNDYTAWREYLLKASKKERCAIHAYALMGNHVHMLVTPHSRAGASRMMQSLGVRYVRYFNTRYGHVGTLWQGRFKSALVQSKRYFFACSRYIELNPVRAAIVQHPADYAWSSYPCNANGADDPLITPHEEYEALGRNHPAQLKAYRKIFVSSLEPATVNEIRAATQSGETLGTPTFRNDVERLLGRRVGRFTTGGDRRSDRWRSSQRSEQ